MRLLQSTDAQFSSGTRGEGNKVAALGNELIEVPCDYILFSPKIIG